MKSLFHLYRQNKSSESKVKFRQTIIIARGFLRLPNLHILIKQKSLSLPRNLTLRNFGKLPVVFSTQVNLCYTSLFNGVEGVLLSASDKANLFAKNFSKYSNLYDSGISLPVFYSRTNLIPHNIFVTPKVFKKVITGFDLSKASGPDYIPAVVFKNYES